jgi:hypothetical protein
MSLGFRRLIPHTYLAAFAAGVLATMLTGCGGGGMSPLPPGAPVPNGSTNVVVLLAATANGQLVSFSVSIQSMVLTGKSGNVVTLYKNSVSGVNSVTEFMHLNGAAEPLVGARIPQGVYTAAIVTTGGCEFTSVTFHSNGLLSATDAEGLCGQGTGNTTVNLATPITISGSAMALVLDLQVSQSFTLTDPAGADTYTISPVFTLTPVAISAEPSNGQNAKVTGVSAQITSVDAMDNSFSVRTISGISLQIREDSNTVFQGVAGLGSLAPGMLVNMDDAIQMDGSLLATRVEVNDSMATAEFAGPWLTLTGEPGVLSIQPFNCFIATGNVACDSLVLVTSDTVFNVSGQLSNLQKLPFKPTFDRSAIFLGQNVTNFSLGNRNRQGVPASTTVTLEPQTINGTVMAISASNGFSTFTVTLASYDLIPTLQAFLGAQANLNNPNTVAVYADANTAFLDSGTIAVGTVLRFRGVIFNDQGTLRMDCIEALDGVPE